MKADTTTMPAAGVIGKSTIETTDLAGHVVLWSFPSGNEIAYSDVRDALEIADLDPDLAKELRPAAAFSRAAKGLKEERRIDKVKQEKGTIRFQLTHVENDGERIDFDRETEITLCGETGEITCPDRIIQQQARELFAFSMRTRTSNDLTKLIQTMFKERADLFPIVPEKGVAYFVPIEHADFLMKVDQFARACGGCLCPFPVPRGTALGNRSVKHTIAAGLQSMTDELMAVVSEWDETTRSSTESKAIAKWEKISYKVEAYAAYLEDEKAKLAESLTLAKTALTAKILEVEEKKEAAKEAKESGDDTGDGDTGDTGGDVDLLGDIGSSAADEILTGLATAS